MSLGVNRKDFETQNPLPPPPPPPMSLRKKKGKKKTCLVGVHQGYNTGHQA